MNDGSATPSVEQYYSSLESRLGYWLLLGNARHCGYWPPGTLWSFPIGRALRTMEEKLYERLELPAGAKTLDAGAGSGVVASYMAKKGLVVQGIDLTPLHVQDAQRVIKAQGLTSDQITVRQGDYHDLSDVDNASLDGVYTMETFVHADDPLKNTLKEGTYESLLEDAGFTNITVDDYTDNVLPLWRLSGILGSVPYDLMRLVGQEKRFTNIMAGVEAYRHWGQGRYISVRAVNP
ncbi:hypothetical protein B0A48_00655 [Cryoendolithus antarcticus]|uniref:Methyltransferase domain-containing protein n=1 Tax=Cryoendolithus antarcticus TaxID=1507870 RepID=A0A1V8TVR9_9PEZI|nr:hypothetical protein B0A48_00655 [Cryoendolithus antarcticus]